VRLAVRELLKAIIDRERAEMGIYARGPYYKADNIYGPTPYWLVNEKRTGNLYQAQPDATLDGCINTSQTQPVQSQQLGAKMLVSPRPVCAVMLCVCCLSALHLEPPPAVLWLPAELRQPEGRWRLTPAPCRARRAVPRP